MKRANCGLLAVCLVGVLAGCSPSDGNREAGTNSSESRKPLTYPYQAAATVGMIADVVRQVAGNHANLEGLIGEGVDPHLYKPTRNDVSAIRRAEIVFYNGLKLEGKMADILAQADREGKTVCAVSEAILKREDYVMTDESNRYDPHLWMDVRGWMRAVQVVAETLREFDPKNAEAYQKNADSYLKTLRRLDDYARETIASIPPPQRVLVTAHDAFRYLGRAYGLEVRGIQGLSTESEAGVKDIETLVSFLVSRKIPAIFVETSVSEKNVQALVEGARAQGHEVKIGGALFSDAMGRSGSYEGTYVGMIDHNVTTIVRALGGKAPEQGMNGKLSRKTSR